MSYLLKNAILNEILNELSKNEKISIKVFLENTIGITKTVVVNGYEAKLMQDGYAVLSKSDLTALRMFIITDKGINFFKNNGYPTDLKKVALSIINREKGKVFSKEVVFKGLGEIERISKVELLKDKPIVEAKETFISDNRNQIEYVLTELDDLFNKIELKKQLSITEIKRYESEIKILIESVLFKEHSFYDNFRYKYVSDNHSLLECYKPAFHILEIHLLSISNDLSGLHFSIKNKVEKLINEGNNDSAVFSAFKNLEIEVKNKSGINETGMGLMNKVFSSNNPIIKLSDDKNEQEGFMYLFKGAMGAIRNREGHNNVKYSTEETIELVNFASFLIRLLHNQK